MKASLFSEYHFDQTDYQEIVNDKERINENRMKDKEKKMDLRFALLASLFAIAFLIIFRPFNIQKEITSKLFVFSGLIGGLHFLLYVLLIYLVPNWSVSWRKSAGTYVLVSLLFLTVFAVSARFIFEIIYPSKNWLFEEWIGGALAVYCLPYLFFYFVSKRYVTTDRTVEVEESEENVTIFDSNSDFLSTLTLANFLYLKAEGNYVKIFWSDVGSIKREIIQTTVKSVESSILNENIVRCHRSYIINQTKIDKIKGNSRGYKAFIGLNDNYLEVPVSSGRRKEISI